MLNNRKQLQIYDVFSGEMPACPGKSCEKSCCHTKSIFAREKGERNYATSMDLDEFHLQNEYFGPLTYLGVDHEIVDINTDRGAPDIRVLIRNCLGPNGMCLLKDRKPLQCRVFPFTMSAYAPLRQSCPHAKTIAQDIEVVNGVLELRRALNILNDESWLLSLKKLLSDTIA